MKKTKDGKATPLMKQYNAIKAKYPGALLLFRVGDFYETFGTDAITASRILGIVLTKRANGAASEVELAGFPHHSLDAYLPKLVRAGQRVAICDQLENPKDAVGIVKRGVTELVTPGVSLDDNVLQTRQNNFLAAIHLDKDVLGMALLDISTGEFYVAQGDQAYVEKLLQSFSPSEVLYGLPTKKDFFARFGDKLNTYGLDDWVFQHRYAYEQLTQHFRAQHLKGFGVEEMTAGVVAAGAVLHYLRDTEHKELGHLVGLSRLDESRYVWLDRFTIRNLELLHPQQEGGVPLIDVLDQTVTPMGARLLRKWVVLPLRDLTAIRERLQAVTALVENAERADELLAALRPLGDVERLISKVAARRINPRELTQLRRALQQTLPIKQLLSDTATPMPLRKLGDQLHTCELLLARLEKELKDEAPVVANQGQMIRPGVHAELDELHAIAFSGKDFLVKLQRRETEKTGISSLKVAYNKVFGYYLEVTHAHRQKVPADWIRKQTLVNAERYITPELKEYEEKILNAEGRICEIEQQLFLDLLAEAADYVVPIQQNARVLAKLDCLLTFARVAQKHQYVCPEVDDSRRLDIRAGRHPVIERQLPVGESYVPNDVHLDPDDQQVIVITGPNMAGKSALLRQTALIALMAQMGSYVPAAGAQVGVVDKVFTRVGASDNLARGESTFMVEMTETASILHNLSDRSLVLMDEIGRGTSTYDGISIAWAIVEYLHQHSRSHAKTLFATHYHELNQLAAQLPRVRNYHIAVRETHDKVIFLRQLRPGGSEHSFGIHVAQMAGMPADVVFRAHEIMHFLEREKINDPGADRADPTQPQVRAKAKPPQYQLNIFEPPSPELVQLRDQLAALDIHTLSPIEALLKLNELKRLLETTGADAPAANSRGQ